MAAAFTTEEGWHTTDDGVKLYTKTWKPTSEVKARVVFIHGFSDHCNAYGPLFPVLASYGIITYTFDQRGWGRSVQRPRDRGLTGPTKRVLADITSFMKALPPGSGVPLFLMGHSMGGAEILHYAVAGDNEVRSQIRGYIAEAPFVAVAKASRPSKGVVIAGRMAARVAPHRQMVQRLDPKLLSRDPEVQKQFEQDELCHDTGTLEGLSAMLDRAASLEVEAVRLEEGMGEGGKTRVWVGHGTEDGVCDCEPTRKVMEGWKVSDKTFKEYVGWYHKLHMEPGDDKKIFANDVAQWILSRSGPADGSAEGRTGSRL
ncbi:uncharacterized protein K452DRAFT_249750 [Aplosporella prunicola CBS 121167]|uniref:Serine aminopeptidase S33 domain-containing protein n=1 Tax=Aplosporella prunicola CBS 121167 TaxID=1176127 RepID=A0A6A6BGK0_9PEZI|nr:uncharacterized protein K452DRAFT_249750 [Aplosporella prunicola CBS 121167]KAF2141997.1 hypothetical protein K452DRAFT_249750 [Aplosporella prunicola CBS 121167]